MADLHELTALEQAAAVRRGEVSPSELVEHYLRRVDGERLGAFVTVTAERAMDSARVADLLVSRTPDPAELPPLLGVPTAIKDLTATAGVRTTFGSAVYTDYVPTVDDDVVRLLADAGTISLGKTSTPEFGLSCYTELAGLPPAVTPWDINRLAGGSSGGAAAAVAGGLVPFAQGSDGAGSIRCPAAACGVVGLKPSRGRVSRGPVGGDVTLLSVIGPLARTVDDAAAMLDAMAVVCPAEPVIAPPLPPGQSFLQHARREPKRLRIGRYIDSPLSGVEVAAECRQAWEDTAILLDQLGHDVVDTIAPLGSEVLTHFEVLWSAGAHAVPVPHEAQGALRPFTRWLRERGAGVSGPELLQAIARIQQAGRAAVAEHMEFDAVLTPTLAQPPRPIGWFSSAPTLAEDFERQKRYMPYNGLYNLTGQPAISLPLHWTDDGLPVGVQLAGRPAGEGSLLALAGQLERARPWAQRRPPTW